VGAEQRQVPRAVTGEHMQSRRGRVAEVVHHRNIAVRIAVKISRNKSSAF
jgi:hypothetical protein